MEKSEKVELGEFIRAGLYDPHADRASQRRELLEHLVARGFSPHEVIETAERVAQITEVAQALTRPRRRRVTLSEAAQLCGTSPDELATLWMALGFVNPADGAADVPETLVEDFALYQLACAQFGRDRTLGFARVLGVAIATMMEAGRELFATPLREADATELQISEANEIAIDAWDRLRDLVGHVMLERAARDIWFEAQLLKGDLMMAVSFIDLVGSTEWTRTAGPDAVTAGLSQFEHLSYRIAVANGGRVVKFIGDEAMITAAQPAVAVRAAVALCEAVCAHPLLPLARGAVAYGRVTARGGDYFGPIVNLASRAAKTARPGCVQVTAEVADTLDPTVWSLTDHRPFELRGFNEPIQLTSVTPRANAAP